MTSHFHLFEPLPAVTADIKANAVFDLPANALSHCFEAQPPIALFANSFAARLAIYQAALDGGYGGQLMQATVAAGDEAALAVYLRARFELLISALDLHEPAGDGRVSRRAFVRILDTTEKTDLGYLLGAVLARVAAGRWLQQVDVFWHAHVAMRATVVVGDVKRASIEEPDFIIGSGNDWFALESKGSMQTLSDARRWNRLKEGLMQAAKWAQLQIWDHTLMGPPQIQPVSAFACSLADFDAAGELQLRLVDPSPARGISPLVVAPFAQLMRFQQAVLQWRRLAWHLAAEAEATAPRHARIFDWALLHRGATPATSLYLGLPPDWQGLEQTLNLAVAAVDVVARALRRQLRPPVPAAPEPLPVRAEPLLRALRAWARRVPEARSWVEQLSERLRRQADLPAVATTLADVLAAVLEAPGLPGDHSIERLLLIQRRGTALANTAVTAQERRLPGQALVTSHGLLVASAAWRGRAGGQSERRLKL
jgi:hypothetical protein